MKKPTKYTAYVRKWGQWGTWLELATHNTKEQAEKAVEVWRKVNKSPMPMETVILSDVEGKPIE